AVSVRVDPADAALLVVTVPTPAPHGKPVTVTVTAKDAFGNVATGYTGIVKLSSSDHSARLPAKHKYTSADLGVFHFMLTLNTIGTQSVTATDTGDGSITGTRRGIRVT